MKYTLSDNITGKKAKYQTTVNIKNKNQTLIFEFTSENSKLFNAYNGYNKPIYEGDVVEVFIASKKDFYSNGIYNYYEIEVAPNGSVFFAKISNINSKFTINYLDNVLDTEVICGNNRYKTKISLPLDKLNLNINEIVYNAYRIETNGKTEINLMALNPTMCEYFHKPDYFIKLNLK